MATVSSFSFCRAHPQIPPCSFTAIPQFLPVQFLRFQSKRSIVGGYSCLRTTRIGCSTEDTAVSEEEAPTTTTSDQTVSIPVSPSDVLTMFFQAEGTMNEAAIPSVTSSLEDIEGISGLKIQVVEGIASVELTKQTTIQATGVASSLVETIQGSGFKLQTLNLSFQDEEDSS